MAVMKIETKFGVGQKVLFIHGEALFCREVAKIEIEIKAQSELITYYFYISPDHSKMVYKYENEVAVTKEELISTLTLC